MKRPAAGSDQAPTTATERGLRPTTETCGIGSICNDTDPAADADSRQPYWLSFPMPARAWSTNERLHWAQRSNLTKLWRTGAMLAARQAHRKRNPAQRLPIPLEGRWQVSLVIPFARGGRRDPMNYVGTCLKATVDGMVTAQVWSDDSPEFVQIVEPRLVVDKSLTVHVRLTPIGPDE